MVSFQNKKVLFITTKNIDYLRNTQEIELIRESANKIKVLGYKEKSYPKRLIKLYFKLITMNVKEYDTVFIGFAPQLILPFFKYKFKNKRIVMDFFISVYDTMVNDRKKFKKGSIFAKLCKWIDKKCINCGENIISDTKAHGDYFSKEFEVDRSKIETLYLKADKSIYYPREQNKPEKIKDKFVVLYFGSVLPLQGVEVIMEAMDKLKNEKDIYFYFIGPVKENIVKTESDNIEYIKWLSQENLAKYISYSDLCIAGHFNKDIMKAKRTIPGKVYIYEAMNKPMILGDNKATRELYTEDKKHYFVEMGNSQALSEKILETKKNLNKHKNNIFLKT